MPNDAMASEPPARDDGGESAFVPELTPPAGETPMPPIPGEPQEQAVVDPQTAIETIISPPGAGIPVPPGAPPDYRGYGITAARRAEESAAPGAALAEAPAVESPAADRVDLRAPAEPSGPFAEPDGFTDSVTVAASAAGAAHDLRGWRLRLPDGSGLLVDGALLIGRSPDPGVGPAGARLVAVDDPARTVSRSHVVAAPAEQGELLLRNVSSVNAVVVIGADGAEFKIQRGGSVLLVDAARVLVGAYPITLERL